MYTSTMTDNRRGVRSVTWDSGSLREDGMQKAQWLDSMATLDARLPEVRQLARTIAMAPIHDPNDREALARDIHGWVRDCIKYIRDPAGEELSDAQQTLLQGFGDCDDKARLFVALCRSVGIDARIRPCFSGDNFVHVQAEVNVGRPKRWMLAELIAQGVPLGANPPKKVVLT
jgi:transglutaminase-like putative cysteine protease